MGLGGIRVASERKQLTRCRVRLRNITSVRLDRLLVCRIQRSNDMLTVVRHRAGAIPFDDFFVKIDASYLIVVAARSPHSRHQRRTLAIALPFDRADPAFFPVIPAAANGSCVEVPRNQFFPIHFRRWKLRQSFHYWVVGAMAQAPSCLLRS